MNHSKLSPAPDLSHNLSRSWTHTLGPQRGSLSGDTSGVRDSVVNQLLAKLDGVNELGNILVVGLTNQKELIDDAMLRPGRLEVHLKIGLPNLEGHPQYNATQPSHPGNPTHPNASKIATPHNLQPLFYNNTAQPDDLATRSARDPRDPHGEAGRRGLVERVLPATR